MTEALDWCVVIWDFAGAPAAAGSSDWSTAAVALISGLIGVSGSWLALGWQARRESRSVRAAILAEIEALLEMAARHKYSLQISDQLADSAIEVQMGIRHARRIRLGIPEHYNRVYLANAPKLGVLSKREARNVVRFYQLIDSLRSDTSEGGRLYEGTNSPEPLKTASRILDVALDIGQSLTVR